MSADARAKALSALARSQVTETAVGDTRHRIAETTLEAIRPAVVPGVTMLGADGHPTTAVYTDPLSPEIDEAQYREGIGPVPRRLAGKAIVRIGHMDAARDHYPGFAAACLPHRMLSIPSMPILGGGVSIGALNLYAHGAEAFDDDAESVASDLAGAAGSCLCQRVRLPERRRAQREPQPGDAVPRGHRAGRAYPHGPVA